MKFKTKIKIIAYFFVATIFILTIKSKAASISVSPSKSSVSPGEKFSISIRANGAIGRAIVTVSGGTADVSSVWLDSSATINVTAGSSGTINISVAGATGQYVMSDPNGGDIIPTAGVASVRIVSNNSGGDSTTNNSNSSGGNNTTTAAPTLSNLGIKPNDFSGFSPNKTSYTVNVPNDCTTVNLYATSKNGTVSGTGNKTLKEGTNKFAVTVTNSAGSKTYYVSVVRKTAEGTEPPNVIDENTPDETENQEQQDGIGLSALEIPGYELDKEFKSDVYSYTIEVKKQLTEAELEALKEKIVATANVENVQVEITTNISEDGVASITISVKDDEKEYAKYVITFEVKKEDIKVAGIIKNNSNTPIVGMFGLTEEQQIYAILGGIGITTFLAIVFACASYAKSRRIAEYEEEDYEEEDSDFEKMNQYYIGMENSKTEEPIHDRSEEITSEPTVKETIEDAATSLRKTNGYRRLARGRRSYGKH